MARLKWPAPRTPARRAGLRRLPWDRLSHEALLDVRLCDLGVRLEGTWIEPAIHNLWSELDARHVPVKPHFWLSSEWFCPDGVPGIAVPFYLLHPRLARLEKKFMGEVEGGTFASSMKILRHEAGHAVQHAFRLQRRREWQRQFGFATKPYPKLYRPRPSSKNHVLHLGSWYAQSHPVEDFAETFAVWLTPGSSWRRRYRTWPALQKLIYVDETMRALVGREPPVRNRWRIDPLHTMKLTLREYYDQKRAAYGEDEVSAYDRDLKSLFPRVDVQRGFESAAAFLHRNRNIIRAEVAKWTREYDFALDHVLTEMVRRCRHLGLRRVTSVERARREFALLLCARTVAYLHTSRDRYAL
jgi:hypothetical protein